MRATQWAGAVLILAMGCGGRSENTGDVGSGNTAETTLTGSTTGFTNVTGGSSVVSASVVSGQVGPATTSDPSTFGFSCTTGFVSGSLTGVTGGSFTGVTGTSVTFGAGGGFTTTGVTTGVGAGGAGGTGAGGSGGATTDDTASSAGGAPSFAGQAGAES